MASRACAARVFRLRMLTVKHDAARSPAPAMSAAKTGAEAGRIEIRKVSDSSFFPFVLFQQRIQ